MAGRHEAPIDSDAQPLRRLARELRELRAAAGSPTYRSMARATGCGASTLSQAASGERLPSAATLRAYVTACGGDADAWEARRQEAAGQQAAAAAPYGPSVAPYRGPARYEPGDAGFYFGREEAVARLLGAVAAHRLTALVGPSGSGKSSLLRAGLVPALRSAPPPLRPAAVRVFTAGPRAADLGAVLAPDEGTAGGDTVVVIDQAEELFAHSVRPERRAEHAAALAACAAPGGRLRVVLGLRADALALLAGHAELERALRDAAVDLPPMEAAELREAVVRPAAAVGLIVERSLTARILREAGREPGSLPLVSHALHETWQRRRGRTLTEEMYEAAGGIHGALAATAEELYGRLSATEAAAARRVLLRLVAPGEGGARDTVRVADRAEFRHGGRDARAALEALVAARLVTVDGGTVAPAHEAVITAWPRLARWIGEERERLRLHRRLTDAAATWRTLGDDPAALYRGGLLAAVEAAFPGRTRALELTTTEREFLVAGRMERTREERAARQIARRVRVLTTSLAVVLALALAGGLTAVRWGREIGEQRKDAAVAQRAADSRRLARQAEALGPTYPDLAGLLAVSAYRTYPTDEALAGLENAAAQPLRRHLADPLPGTPVARLAFSSDGKSLAGGGGSGVLGVWDLDTGRLRTVRVGAAKPAAAVAFTPDSAGLVVDRVGGGLDRYRAATITAGAHLTEPAAALTVLSADGRVQAGVGAAGGAVSVRDAGTGRVLLALPAPYEVTALAVSRDGAAVAAAGGGRVTVWDTRTGRVVAAFADRDRVGALVLDGHGRTVLAQGRLSVRLWDVPSGREWPAVPCDSADGLQLDAPALSPDGRTAAGGAGHTAWEWDVRAGTVRATLAGHTADVTAVSFTADGRSLATGDASGDVRVWEVPRRPVETPCPGTCDATAVSGDGRTLAVAYGGAVRVYGAGSRTVPGTGGGGATALALDPYGGTLAVAGPGGRVRVVPLAGGPARTLGDTGGTVTRLLFAPGGRMLAGLAGDRTVWTWDIASGRAAHTASAGTAKLHSLAFSPDGRTLAAGDAAGGVGLWDPATLRPAGRLRSTEPGGVQELDGAGLAFSPDGRQLAAGTARGEVLVWDLATRRPRVVPTGRTSPVAALAYDAAGTTLACGLADGTVELRDPATGGAKALLAATAAPGLWLAFAPSGDTLFVGGRNAPAGRWLLHVPDPAQALARVCRAVSRELTPREQSAYLPAGARRSGCGA